MYQSIKKIITSILPKKMLFKYEFFLRSIYALLYSGKSFECNVCQKKLRCFNTNLRKELLCPNCGSLGRDRRLWQLLESKFLIENSNVLDFSPSRSLYKKLKSNKLITYSSTDLSGNFLSDFQYDITNLPIKKNSCDLIICYHILEHIENDLLAISELFRVLKPEGRIIFQTPFKEGDNYENHLITTSKERLKHFGQEDHVRIYSINGLKEKLIKTGFIVEIHTFNKDKSYYGLLLNETILICKKI